MKKRVIQHHTDALAALLLFGVFAACILSVLLTGAEAYRRLTRRDQAAYARRTAVQYIATRVRQAEAAELLSQVIAHPVVEPGHDLAEALALIESDQDLPVLREDGEYATRVYCHEGYLKELYASEEDLMVPGDGERIMAAEGLELSLDQGLLTVSVTGENGEESTLLLSLRSGEEGRT